MAKVSGVDHAYRVFLNGRYTYVLYACSEKAAIEQITQKLGKEKTATTRIKVYRANSASD